MAEADFAQSECSLWHLRGAVGGKLPQQKPRCPRTFAVIENVLWEASGGCKGGRSVDAGNTTGNQEQVTALLRRQRLISVPFRPAAKPSMAAQIREAALASDCRAQPHNRPHLAARRAGVPSFAGGRNPVPEGQQKQKSTSPGGQSRAPRRRPKLRRRAKPRARRAAESKSIPRLTGAPPSHPPPGKAPPSPSGEIP